MGFGKAFGIGLILLIALNFIFALLIAALSSSGIGTFFSGLFSPLSNLGEALTDTMQSDPSIAMGGIIGLVTLGMGTIDTLLGAVSLLVVPLIAAIITGRLAEGKGAAFGAWFLIVVIAIVIDMLFGFLAGSVTLSLFSIMQMVELIALNGIFYSAFALLSAGSEYY